MCEISTPSAVSCRTCPCQLWTETADRRPLRRSGKIPRPKPEDSHGMSPMAVERKKQLAAAAAAAASGEAPAADAAPAAAEGTKEDL